MKIYTKTGDDGSTGLIGGRRISKADIRIEAYGTVDELNATLGLTVASDTAGPLTPLLRSLQNELFALGSHLATPVGSPHAGSLPPIKPEWITRLETEIDGATAKLPPLAAFILPGGTELAARLHLARTVARRAERLTVSLHQSEPVDEIILTYLNRLSDWLFVYARLANQLGGAGDIPWAKQM